MTDKEPIKLKLSTVILSFIIFILIIGMILMYFYFTNSKNTTNTVENTTTDSTKNVLSGSTSNTTVSNTEAEKIENTVESNQTLKTDKEETTTEKRYSNFMNNLIKTRNSTNGNWLRDSGDSSYTYIKNNGEAYLILYNELAKKYGEINKLYDDVVFCKRVYYNQGGVDWFVFVHEDGTVSRVLVSSDGIEKKDYKNIKNIVNISTIDAENDGPVDTTCPICFDIDGNSYKLD